MALPADFPGDIEYVSVDLGNIQCVLDYNYTPYGATMTLISTYGLPYSGYAYIGGNIFEYTKDSTYPNTILNITKWIKGGLEAIEAGADVFSYDLTNNVVRTGWPHIVYTFMEETWIITYRNGELLVTTINDPNYPPIQDYWNSSRGTGWQWTQDWTRVHTIAANASHIATGLYEIKLITPIWMRHVMVLFHHMSDGGLAKLNEIQIYPSTALIDNINDNPATGLPGDLEGTDEGNTIGGVASHLVCGEFGLPGTKFYSYGTMPVISQQTSRASLLDSSKHRRSNLRAYSCFSLSTLMRRGHVPTLHRTKSARARRASIAMDAQDTGG